MKRTSSAACESRSQFEDAHVFNDPQRLPPSPPFEKIAKALYNQLMEKLYAEYRQWAKTCTSAEGIIAGSILQEWIATNG
jgi:hypothetical protein